MGKSKAKPFIDRKNASVYRLVHPTVPGESEGAEDDSTAERKITPVFQKIRGEVDYFSEEEEEYPYREDSGDEGEEHGEYEEEYQEEGNKEYDDECEDEDEFDCSESAAGAGGSQCQKNVWLRSKEETMSEYSSWSSRSASSYLPPARRRQLWRDIEELGLADDGYDYTQHLRNAGGGVRIDAKMSADLIAFLDRKKQQAEKSMTRSEKEVVALLYDSDEERGADKDDKLQIVEEADGSSDEDAPPLDDDDRGESSQQTNAKTKQSAETAEGAPQLEHGVIVEEGDELPDDFVLQMMGGDDSESWDAGSVASSSRPSRLVDDQFEVMLKKYDDAELGELPDDHPGLQARGTVADYYNILDEYIAACKPPPADEADAAADDAQQHQQPEQEDSMDEEERAELVAKTKALALAELNGHGSGEEDGDEADELEEAEVEQHEQWDCESILSTYSNLYNHPALIRDARGARVIRIDPRTGVPAVAASAHQDGNTNTNGRRAKPAKDAAAASQSSGEEEEEVEEGASVSGEVLARRKDESKEDKAARKQAAKEAKSRALARKREAKEASKVAARPAHKVNAFDPRARPGLSLQHLH